MRELLLNSTTISDICRSFIPNKTTYTKDWFYSVDFQNSLGALKFTEYGSTC